MRSECSVGTSVTSVTSPRHCTCVCEQTQKQKAKEKKRGGGETESNTERETTDEWRAPVQASGRGSHVLRDQPDACSRQLCARARHREPRAGCSSKERHGTEKEDEQQGGHRQAELEKKKGVSPPQKSKLSAPLPGVASSTAHKVSKSVPDCVEAWACESAIEECRCRNTPKSSSRCQLMRRTAQHRRGFTRRSVPPRVRFQRDYCRAATRGS